MDILLSPFYYLVFACLCLKTQVYFHVKRDRTMDYESVIFLSLLEKSCDQQDCNFTSVSYF